MPSLPSNITREVTERDYKGLHAFPSTITRDGPPITRDCPPSLLISQGRSLTARSVSRTVLSLCARRARRSRAAWYASLASAELAACVRIAEADKHGGGIEQQTGVPQCIFWLLCAPRHSFLALRDGAKGRAPA